MPKVTQREAARRDLVEQFVLLAENAGPHIPTEPLRTIASKQDHVFDPCDWML